MGSSKITGFDIDPAYGLKQIQVSLPSSGWSDAAPYTQTVTVNGATATNIIICAPEPEQTNFEKIGECKVMCTAQAVDALTFTAYEGLPEIDLTFNILVGGE